MWVWEKEEEEEEEEDDDEVERKGERDSKRAIGKRVFPYVWR